MGNNPVVFIDPTGEVPAVAAACALYYGGMIYKSVTSGMAIANSAAAVYLLNECRKCHRRATDMCRRAKKRLSPERYRAWRNAAKPHSECSEVCMGAVHRGIAAGGWWLGRLAGRGFPRARPVYD